MGMKGTYENLLFAGEPAGDLSLTEDRNYDVCIALQWRGPAEANVFWMNYSNNLKKFFDSVVELQETEENRDTFVAYIAAARHFGIPIDNLQKHIPAIRALYWYARKKERINLIQQLSRSKLKIALIGGKEWHSIIQDAKNITIIEECPHDKLTDFYKSSKSVICLNNYNGASERVFDALGAGAWPICEDSPALKNHFNKNELSFYHPNSISETIEEIEYELIDQKFTDRLSLSIEKYNKTHVWKTRIQSLNASIESLLTK